jgi:hypothetical protein
MSAFCWRGFIDNCRIDPYYGRAVTLYLSLTLSFLNFVLTVNLEALISRADNLDDYRRK